MSKNRWPIMDEAERRFGVNWKNVKLKTSYFLDNKYMYTPAYDSQCDILWNRNGIIYEKGVWSELEEGESIPNIPPNEKMRKAIGPLQLINIIIQIFGLRVYKGLNQSKVFYGVIYNVIPFTGWRGSYKPIFGKKVHMKQLYVKERIYNNVIKNNKQK